MKTTKVTESIEFAYEDSGAPPSTEDYHTIIVIHGFTYHSGTFSRMLKLANSLGHRIIVPNRRLYPGSTSFTKEEAEAFDPSNSSEDITKAFLKQGEYILLFVRNMITEYDLKKVILVGWSLGSSFLCSAVASITALPDDSKSRLLEAIKTIVWWDPPATVVGISPPPSGGWTPLFDETLTPEEKGQAFSEWISQYYPHPGIDKKDCYSLIYKMAIPVKNPSFSDIPFDEFLTKVDLTAGVKGDNRFVDLAFLPIAKNVKSLALFSATVRDAWKNIPFAVAYGEETVYNVIWAVWQLEEEAKKTGFPITFKSIPGANHFPMHDLPELTFDILLDCV